MSSKAILCVLAAFLALQGASASLDWATVKQDIETLVNNTQAKFEQLEEDATTAYHQVVDQAKEKFANISDAIDKAVQEANKTATEVGVDIKACVADLPSGQDLAENATLELVSCVADKVKEAKAIAEDVVAQVKQAVAIVTDTEAALAKCSGNAIAVALCKSKAVAGAVTQEGVVAAKISADIAKGTAIVSSLKTELEACAAKKALQLLQLVGSLTADLAKCVADKQQEA